MALNARQSLFVREYLIDLNASAAYKRAGYDADGHVAEVNASRLLSNADVSAAIQLEMDKRAANIGIDAAYVLNTIKTAVERCMQSTPVLDRKGEPVFIRANDSDDAELVPAYTFDSAGVFRGSELLGKHLKLFTEKIDVNNVTPLTQEQVDEKLAALLAKRKTSTDATQD